MNQNEHRQLASPEWELRGPCCHHVLSHWLVGRDSWRKVRGHSWGQLGGLWAVATYQSCEIFWYFHDMHQPCSTPGKSVQNRKVPPLLGTQLGTLVQGIACRYRRPFVMTILTENGGRACIPALLWGWHAVFMFIPKGAYTEQSWVSLFYYIRGNHHSCSLAMLL